MNGGLGGLEHCGDVRRATSTAETGLRHGPHREPRRHALSVTLTSVSSPLRGVAQPGPILGRRWIQFTRRATPRRRARFATRKKRAALRRPLSTLNALVGPIHDRKARLPGAGARRKPRPGEAEEHHRPGRRLRNAGAESANQHIAVILNREMTGHQIAGVRHDHQPIRFRPVRGNIYSKVDRRPIADDGPKSAGPCLR